MRFVLLRLIASILCPSYRMRYNVLDWMCDEEFNHYLGLFGEAKSLKAINAGRRWMIFQLVRLTDSVPGDTAECGVYHGAASYLIAAFNARSTIEQSHHVFDSFDGLSATVAEDGMHWRQHDLTADMSIAEKVLSRFNKVHFHKGWIPKRFVDVADQRFSFVHIDVDLYEPTRDSLNFFYPRLNEGGVIVCDDYGSSVCPGATRAVDEFLRDKPEKVVALSDGGGFLIKSVPTAAHFDLMWASPRAVDLCRASRPDVGAAASRDLPFSNQGERSSSRAMQDDSCHGGVDQNCAGDHIKRADPIGRFIEQAEPGGHGDYARQCGSNDNGIGAGHRKSAAHNDY
jgi:O-methyltransferase